MMRIDTTLRAAALASAVVIAGLTMPVMAQDDSAGGDASADAATVIATVGDTEITLGQMIITRAQLPQQYAQLPDDVLFTGILDQLIQQQLLADDLDDVPARVEYALQNERRTLMAGEVINTITSYVITDEAIQGAYDARYGEATPETEYNASHLLVETEEEAQAALARITDSDEAFADVARDVSTGPTGPNGGSLGWFGAGQMVTEFEQAVQEMAVGDVTGPVQTQFGWHVIMLNETRTAELPPLDSVRGEITAELQEAALQARLATLEEEIEVTRPEEGAFDPALLSNLDLLEP